jgi:hypothetical protein
MITRIAWSDAVDRGLARALPEMIRSIVAAECRAGVSQVWECDEGAHHAYVVTRVDANPTEWVMVAFEGSGMHKFAPAFIAAARERGIPMRVHTVSPVIARLLRPLGFQQTEYVLRRAA